MFKLNPYPKPKILRKMGFNRDQEGIINRWINEEEGWANHLTATKKFIEQCILDFQPGNIGILGSGWLLDVPIDFLVENCKTVYLYDIRHPRQIVHRYESRKNVQFIYSDITGGAIDYIYHAIKEKKVQESLDTIPTMGFRPGESLDYTISVNILTQLDILIIENLRKLNFINADLLRDFSKKIQSDHINSLPTGKSGLITEFEEQLHDRTGTFISSNSLLFTTLPKGKAQKEWVWNFDTSMTYYPNRKTYFKVLAKQL